MRYLFIFSCDYVEILHDGGTWTSQDQGSGGQQELQLDIQPIAASNEVRVRFKTDATVHKRGFLIGYLPT